MTNQELFDAIAFAYQSCIQGGTVSEAGQAMLTQLRELLACQLARAKGVMR